MSKVNIESKNSLFHYEDQISDTKATAKTKKELKLQTQKLKSKLAYISSPTFFRSNSLECFRRNLENCFHQDLLRLALIPSDFQNITKYDDDIIQECLDSAIPWNDLCKHHDDAQTSSSSTALQETLQIIIQDWVCLHSILNLPVILVLFKTLVSVSCFLNPSFTNDIILGQSNRHQHRPASVTLIQTNLRHLLTSCPPMTLMSKPLANCLRRCLLNSTQSTAITPTKNTFMYSQTHLTLTTHTLDTTLWFLQVLLHPHQQRHVRNQGRGLAMGKEIILTLVQLLSDTYASVVSNYHPYEPSQRVSQSSQKQSKIKRKFITRSMHSQQHDIDIDALNHGEDNDDGSGICIHTKHSSTGEFHRIRLKKNNITSTQNNEISSPPPSKTSLASSFRITILKSIISILNLLALNSHQESQHAITFQAILRFALKEPSCIMRRWVLLSCATSDLRSLTFEAGLGKVFTRIWKDFCDICDLSSTAPETSCDSTNLMIPLKINQAGDLIRMYTDFAVNCKAMETSERCWRVFSPLHEKVISIADLHESDRNKNLTHDDTQDEMSEEKKTNREQNKPKESLQSILLRGIEYILAYRARLLAKEMNRFESALVQLSSYYGNRPHLWISPLAPLEEQKRTLDTLHCFNICSHEPSSHLLSLCSEQKSEKERIDIWPFPSHLTLQHLYSNDEYIRRTHVTTELLSNHDSCTEQQPSFAEQYRERKALEKKTKDDAIQAKAASNISILEYLHDDITRIIFSFMGYKRMARVMSVCKSWHRLGKKSQYLWKDFYMKRWPNYILSEDSVTTSEPTPNQTNLDWNQLFVKKWKIERSVRSKFNKDMSWKFQVCHYVECNKISRTKLMWDKHMKWHSDKQEKARQKQIATIEAQKRKAISKEENVKKRKSAQPKQTKIPSGSKLEKDNNAKSLI